MEEKKVGMEEERVQVTEEKQVEKTYDHSVNYFGVGRFLDEYQF
ncbi:hypothetical protein [Anaeromicrobium sediminis]|nr:hypothetical protein [Anaeromicrobium sediminis]